MNVTVIAPHPDDEAIGCGGTICRRVARGDNVGVVFLTSGELALTHLPRAEAWRLREAEAQASASVLGISRLAFLRQPDGSLASHIDGAAAALASALEEQHPATVYLPHELDGHPDHRVSMTILKKALEDYRAPAPTLLTYETWSPLPAYDYVEDITGVIRKKMQALRCHASQIGHFRYDRAARGLSQYRGELAARTRYAEVFLAAPAGDVVRGSGT